MTPGPNCRADRCEKETTLHFAYRTLTKSDAAAWCALRLEGVREFPMGFLVTEDEARQISEARAGQILSVGDMRGVFEEKQLVGFCGYRPQTLERTRHRAEIGPFFVTASRQGSGAAQVLMDGVRAEAEAAELAYLELYVDCENHRAIAFYKASGFEKVATIPDGVRMEGSSRDDDFYRLRL